MENKRKRRAILLPCISVTIINLIILGTIIISTIRGELIVLDALLLFSIELAVTIGVLAYIFCRNNNADTEDFTIQKRAEKYKVDWLTSTICWQIVSIWMTVVPLFCTCAAIYLSGEPLNEDFERTRILIYSILSLVISLGTYVVRPSSRAMSYRRAYQEINGALMNYKVNCNKDINEQKLLIDAIVKGEEHITEQETQPFQ